MGDEVCCGGEWGGGEVGWLRRWDDFGYGDVWEWVT